jgi:UDP-N-acetylmuramoylalanine--D-glutamate ligase
MDKNNFKDKKVLILGLGINQGGLGATKFFAESGAKVRVTDLKSIKELKPSLDELSEFDISYTLGEHKEEDIDWAELIIRNPSVRPDNKFLKYALDKGKQVEMDLGIFLQFVDKNQLIAITGTKGKSTTSSLIYEVLKSQNENVILAGNIGKSVLDIIPHIDKDSLVILELSSFQLQAFIDHQFSPHIAVITNIYPDHLNYHGSMEEYIKAKKAICLYQTADDFVFLNKDNEIISSEEFKKGLKGKVIYYSLKDLPEEFKPNLLGQHNRANIAAALKVAAVFGINEEEALINLKEFSGVPFRLELIYSQDGIRIYNDTTATNPGATVKALESINSPILIVGGMDKDLDYEELAFEIDRKVKSVYFLEGDATDQIKKYLKHKNILRSIYTDLNLLLKDIQQEAKKGDTILFSPGATSYNLFQNEFDRGKKFNEAVKRIFK